MFKKIKEYLKNATFKSVLKDVVKVAKEFFAWRFAMITIGGLASVFTYLGVSRFFGFIFIAYFVVCIFVELVRIHKENNKE